MLFILLLHFFVFSYGQKQQNRVVVNVVLPDSSECTLAKLGVKRPVGNFK